MLYTYSEEQIKNLIFSIKWEKGFKCRKCKSKNSKVGKTTFDKKCTNCSTNYPLTANTAFHGQRMPLDKAIAMLMEVQNTYIKFIESDEYKIKEEIDFDEDDDEDPLTIKWKKWKKDKKVDFRFAKTPARRSSQKLANIFEIEKKSVEAFFKKLSDCVPANFGRDCYADNKWFKNLKTEESKKEWTKIFNLFFRPDDYKYYETDIEREVRDVLSILIYGKEIANGKLYYMGEDYYTELEERERDKEYEEMND